MSAVFRVVVLVAACGGGMCFGGCALRSHSESAEPTASPAAPRPEETPGAAASPPPLRASWLPPAARFFLSDDDDRVVLARIESSPILSLRRFGSTSLGFRARLESRERVALKPRTHRNPDGWAADVVAYRLSRALGMDQVPPVGVRRIRRDELIGLLNIDSPDEIEQVLHAIRWDADGSVPCEVTPWIEGMRDAGLDDERRAEWTSWLDKQSGVSPPHGSESLARDISTVLLFDWLIRNFDRMTGDNMKTDASGKRLVIRDHNLAFRRGIISHAHRETQNLGLLAERVSRSFVEGLLRLDETWLREMTRTKHGRMLLDEERLDGVLDRRGELLRRFRELGVLDEDGDVVYADFE